MSKSLKLVAATLLACAIAMPVLAQGKLEAKPEAKSGPRYKIGRAPTAEEIRGWDIDVRPDGQGLPEGKGSVVQGEKPPGTNTAFQIRRRLTLVALAGGGVAY
jgi:cytochrome c